MRGRLMTALLGATLAALGGAAWAQSPPAQQGQAGVDIYPPSFFADYRPDTALDMVQRLPGFAFDGGATVRGFAGAEGNVRIDGQLPASRGDSMAAILRRLPASSVERIELISGGAPGIDMQGKSLVANVVRKRTTSAKTTATVGGAMFEDGRATPNLRLETQRRWTDRVFDGAIYYGEDLDGGEGPRTRGFASPITSDWDAVARFRSAGASGAYEQPWGAGRIRLNAAVSATPTAALQRDFPPVGVFPSAETTKRERYSAEAGARYTLDYGSGGQVQLIGYQQRSWNDLDIHFEQGPTLTDFAVDRELGESILRGTFRLPKRGAWSIDGGLETDFNWLDSTTAFSSGGVAVVLPAADVRVEELRGEAFGNATWTATPKLMIQAGLRYEVSDIAAEGRVDLEKRLSYLKPRLVFNFTPAKGHLAVLRIERVVDQLSFDDFSATASLTNGTIVAGNPNLEPQVTWLAEARYERRFGSRGAFVLQYIHRDIDKVVGRNLIVTPDGIYEAPDNIGEGVKDVAVISLALPLDRIGIPGGLFRGSYVWRESELTDPITLLPRTFSGDAPYDWDLHFSQDLTARNIRWGADVYKTAKSYAFLTREIATAEGEALVSAFIEYRPMADVTLRAEALNLLDRNYATTREVYSAPRNTGVVNFRERRDLRRSLGGRGVAVSMRRSF